MKNVEKTEEINLVVLLRVLAGSMAIFSIFGLLVLLGPWAIAAEGDTPKEKGFTPGQQNFSNPFVNSELDPEDPTLNDDSPTPPPAPSANARPGGPGGNGRAGAPSSRSTPSQPSTISVNPGAKDPNDVPNPVRGSGGVEVGGGPPSGVIPGGNSQALTIDTETALGKAGSTVITDFNFPDADILEIAKTLGKLTGKNFIYDKDVKGRVSIVSNSAITLGDAWRAFLTALDMNGFSLVPSGEYIRIARQRDARDKQLRTYTGSNAPDTDALITRVMPLKHIGAQEIARVFRSFMPPNSRIVPHDQTNTVIVTDTGSNIAKLVQLLDYLDVEGFDAGIEVIPVRFASAAEIAKLIDSLLPGTQTGSTAARRSGGSSFTARRTKEGGIINNIISDERTNTLIVHANGAGAEQVRVLVAKLDRKVPLQSGGGKIHVIYLQFADAEEVAKTLNNLSSGAGAGGGAGGGTPSAPRAGGGRGNPIQASLFEGSIKISPDKSTNSLVITASPGDFAVVQRVIGKLDIPRDEVYLEAVIMEMSFGRDFVFSANLALPGQGISTATNGDLMNFITNPLGQTGLVLGFQKGEEKTFTINDKEVKVKSMLGLIRALQTNANGNILATPQILTLDNTEATFETSEKIPVPTKSSDTAGRVSETFTKENVSLMVKVKPQINKLSNFVKMDIEAKLEDISNRELPTNVAGSALATLSRDVKTSVVVADTDTVVLGGLVSDKNQKTVRKIPILGDIPILGWLFRSTQSDVKKTNLLVFMTPHIVRQYEKVRAILDRKLKERDAFIEENAGGEDTFKEFRDDMIKRLPELSEIKPTSGTATSTIDPDINKYAPDVDDFDESKPTTTPEAALPDPAAGTPPPVEADGAPAGSGEPAGPTSPGPDPSTEIN